MKLLRYLIGSARSGQTALVIVLALPVVVGSLALVIDVGNLYFNKIRMQTATDSAVLAGGNYLPAYPTQAVTVAQDYAVTNGIKSSEIQSIQVTPDDKAVTMTVARHLPCYFCAVLGASIAYADTTTSSPSPSGFGNVSTTATAEIEPINAVSGVVPIGVDYQTNLNFGNVVMLKQGQVGPGNWEPLALGGTGGSNFNYNVENGYSGTITVGDELQTEPGNLVGPTNQSMNYRINEGQTLYPSATFQNHTLDDPRVMVVPLVDFSSINGSSDVPLKGFAVMWLSSADAQGDVTCYFIEQSVPGATPDPNGSGNTGATTAVLIK